MHLALCVASEALAFQRGGEENGKCEADEDHKHPKAAPAAATLGGVVYQRSYTWTTQHHELQRDLYLVPFVLIRFRIRLCTLIGHMLSNLHEYNS
jgi:hypothetical protein